MNVVMAGLDYNVATIEVRERFAFTTSALEAAYEAVLTQPQVLGAVIVSTCNRTELYLSCEDGAVIDAFGVLCGLAGLEHTAFWRGYHAQTGQDAIKHLCEVACGVKSQIWGEDQIITQVKNAITTARAFKASDPVLEVMFRNAITAAKKVKSTIVLNTRESSIVFKALALIKENKRIKKVLVIGNGEIGRLMVSVLVEHGYDTTMTLRQYRHGENSVPEGAKTVNYNERYSLLSECDAAISATLSPHHTLEVASVQQLEACPALLIDLAVPRDIDPDIGRLINVNLYDVDSICADEVSQNHAKQLKQVGVIVQKYIDDFENWHTYKKGLVCV